MPEDNSDTVDNINSQLSGNIKRSKKRPTISKSDHKERSEWKDVLTFKPMEGTVDIPIQTTPVNRRHQYLIDGLHVRDYVRLDVTFAVQKGYVSHIISDLEWNANDGRANFAKYLVLEAIIAIMSNIYMGLPDELVQPGRFAKGTQFGNIQVLRSFNANFAPLGSYTDGDKIVKPFNPLGILDGLSRMFVHVYDLEVNNDNYNDVLFADQLWKIPFMTFTNAERHEYARAFSDAFETIVCADDEYSKEYNFTYDQEVDVEHAITLTTDTTNALNALNSLNTMNVIAQLHQFDIGNAQDQLNATIELATLFNASINGNDDFANNRGQYFNQTHGHNLFSARLTRFKVENDDFVRCVQKLLFTIQSSINDASDAVMLSSTRHDAEAHDLLPLCHIEVHSHDKSGLASYCYAALNGFTLPITRNRNYRTTIQVDETELFMTVENRFNKLAVSTKD